MDVTDYLTRSRSPETRTAQYAQLVQTYYDNVTPFYRRGWGEHFHFAPVMGTESLASALGAQHALLARRADITAGMRVLDVGCGIGGPGRSLARLTGARVTGVTISPAQVRTAQELNWKQGLQERCQVVLGDAMDLDFKDEVFDAVVAIESGCHMPDKARLFRECARVLKPGGRLAGWDWIRTAARVPTEDMRACLESICVYFALPSLSTLEEIRANLAAAGLEIETVDDLAPSGDPLRRWWEPLDRQLAHPLSRVTARISATLGMMQHSASLLVQAGKAGAFSPLGFFVARKPSH